jgi:hypothetical protein
MQGERDRRVAVRRQAGAKGVEVASTRLTQRHKLMGWSPVLRVYGQHLLGRIKLKIL